MFVIDENYQAIKEVESDGRYYYWAYSAEQRDFFLRSSSLWFNMKTEAYDVMIGSHTLTISSNYYIVIGDISGDIDCVKPDEIVGRDFDALTFSRTLDEETWKLEPIKIVGFRKDFNILYPWSKEPTAVLVSPDRCVLISDSDVYKKIKDCLVPDIV